MFSFDPPQQEAEQLSLPLAAAEPLQAPALPATQPSGCPPPGFGSSPLADQALLLQAQPAAQAGMLPPGFSSLPPLAAQPAPSPAAWPQLQPQLLPAQPALQPCSCPPPDFGSSPLAAQQRSPGTLVCMEPGPLYRMSEIFLDNAPTSGEVCNPCMQMSTSCFVSAPGQSIESSQLLLVIHSRAKPARSSDWPLHAAPSCPLHAAPSHAAELS